MDLSACELLPLLSPDYYGFDCHQVTTMDLAQVTSIDSILQDAMRSAVHSH